LQRFRPKALRATGFLVILAHGLSHQFASFFIAFHPDVSQACPKTMAPETQVDWTEIETYGINVKVYRLLARLARSMHS
jgi:hypothetical protein